MADVPKYVEVLGDKRHHVPIFGAAVAVFTLLTCVIVGYANDTYFGGLAWPYFSDTGRDPPAYYLFAIGLTLAGAASAWTWMLSWWYWGAAAAAASNSKAACHNKTGAVVGAVGQVGLVLLACFDTAHYENTHAYAAYLFFVFSVVAVVLNFLTVKALAAHDPEGLGPTLRVKRVIVGVFALAFLLYIPIGLAVVCTWERLPVATCIDDGYGEDYCDDMRLSDDPDSADYNDTVLWDYGDCLGVNQMRSLAQLFSVLSLLAYIGSMTVDLRHKNQYALPAKGSDNELPPV